MAPIAPPEGYPPAPALDRLPTDRDLPYSDGEPMESPWHRAAMNLLIESLECHWHGRKDFYVGGNMFLYFGKKQVFHKNFRGPDFFFVKGVDHDKERLSWVVWQENNKFPNVIVELLSPSTAKIDRTVKKKLYSEEFATPEYFCYDPSDHTIEGWRLSNGRNYEPLEVEGGRIWSKELELYLGTWEGEFLGHADQWPRLFTVRGELIPIFAEGEKKKTKAAKKRANAEKKRADTAETENARLRAELAALKQPPQP